MPIQYLDDIFIFFFFTIYTVVKELIYYMLQRGCYWLLSPKIGILMLDCCYCYCYYYYYHHHRHHHHQHHHCCCYHCYSIVCTVIMMLLL